MNDESQLTSQEETALFKASVWNGFWATFMVGMIQGLTDLSEAISVSIGTPNWLEYLIGLPLMLCILVLFYCGLNKLSERFGFPQMAFHIEDKPKSHVTFPGLLLGTLLITGPLILWIFIQEWFFL